MRFSLAILCWLMFPFYMTAQQGYLSGTVTDSITREPLAFVSIIYNHQGHGVVTNLEGHFRIPRSQSIHFLKFRYVGYHSKTIELRGSVSVPLNIALSPDPRDIAEVIVYPTENPAHRIIKRAAANRIRNNPEKSGPFSYISYDKMTFTLEVDSAALRNKGDSVSVNALMSDSISYGTDMKGKIDIRRFFEKQHLFMMESVISRKFFSPERNKEEVIASRVSGISQPSFVVMARQFQSFSFYENFVTIADRQFLNPIASGSTSMYFFQIQDTTYTERFDTVYIISFRPMKGKNFDGMKGVLYINSRDYAVQNVLAEAYEPREGKINAAIQQQYELIDGVRWFPVLLSTTVRFNPASLGYKSPPVDIVGIGKSHIVNINLRPSDEGVKFSNVQVEVGAEAHRQPDEVWNAYRTDSLDARERETYRVIDSLGKAEHLDRTIASFETLITGYLPGEYWAFDLMRFIDYNSYEGFRIGAGGRTTQQLCRWLMVGGYGAYGFKDKAWKYSGHITFNLWPEHEIELTALYRKDVRESGAVRFNETINLTGSAFIRNYLVELMDKTRETEFSLSFSALKYVKVRAYLLHSNAEPTNNYSFGLSDANPRVSLTRFNITETGMQIRYAHQETFMKTPRGNKFSMGTRYPVLYLNVARGINLMNGGFEYWRTEVKIAKSFKTKRFGDTRFALLAGKVSADVPYCRLYAGMSSYKPFTLETEQSFGTMRFNEFLADRFVALFVKQDFGKLLIRPRGKFQPELTLVHNIGFGGLSNGAYHENINVESYGKGYFEGGLLINNLVRVQLFKYGLGVLYRYGPYAYSKTIDNFAFKLTLQFNL